MNATKQTKGHKKRVTNLESVFYQDENILDFFCIC